MIFWKKGNHLLYICEDKPCYETSRYKKDVWHVNAVEDPI